MLSLEWTVSLFLGIFTTLLIYRWLKPPKGKFSHLPQPPGPPAWPLIGHLLLLYKNKNNTPNFLSSIAKNYGPVVRLLVGGQETIILSSWETIKEAFVTQIMQDKPTNSLAALISGNTGILLSNGFVWKEQRRFTAMWLRNLGAGKRILENSIGIEVEEICEAFKEKQEQSFDPRPLLGPCSLNIIWALVAGKRFLLDDPELTQLLKLVNNNIQLAARTHPISFLPWIRYIPILGRPYWKIIKNRDTIYDFLNKMIKEKKMMQDVHADTTDLMTEYVKQQQKDIDTNNVNSSFTDPQILRVALDMFVAGSETTATTLAWALLLLAAHQKDQSQLQEEIDSVIGRSMTPSMSHRSQMPFTEAVLAEVQRFGCIVPIVNHAAPAKGAELKGMKIAPRASILANFWAVMRDPHLWKQPEKFEPQRFLDEDGKFKPPECFAPFSAGPRACVGEALAKMELFLFFVAFGQKFTFLLPPGEIPSFKPVPGATMSPMKCNIIAKLR